jgi:hypothetical protein
VDDAGFILGSWILTAVAIGSYALWVVRKGRRLTRHADRSELPWT